MNKTYECPVAELVEFDVQESIMDTTLLDPGFSEGLEMW